MEIFIASTFFNGFDNKETSHELLIIVSQCRKIDEDENYYP